MSDHVLHQSVLDQFSVSMPEQVHHRGVHLRKGQHIHIRREWFISKDNGSKDDSQILRIHPVLCLIKNDFGKMFQEYPERCLMDEVEVDESWLEETPYGSPSADLSEPRKWRNGTSI
jgi:hypothetical protein